MKKWYEQDMKVPWERERETEQSWIISSWCSVGSGGHAHRSCAHSAYTPKWTSGQWRSKWSKLFPVDRWILICPSILQCKPTWPGVHAPAEIRDQGQRLSARLVLGSWQAELPGPPVAGAESVADMRHGRARLQLWTFSGSVCQNEGDVICKLALQV